MLRSIVIWAIMLLGGTVAAEEMAEADERALEGEWKVVNDASDLRGVDDPSYSYRWKFDRGRMFILFFAFPADTVKKVYAVFPDKNPKQMDFRSSVEYTPAIYKLEDDLLTVCLPTRRGVRPTEFRDGNGCQLIFLRRMKRPTERWFLPDEILRIKNGVYE